MNKKLLMEKLARNIVKMGQKVVLKVRNKALSSLKKVKSIIIGLLNLILKAILIIIVKLYFKIKIKIRKISNQIYQLYLL